MAALAARMATLDSSFRASMREAAAGNPIDADIMRTLQASNGRLALCVVSARATARLPLPQALFRKRNPPPPPRAAPEAAAQGSGEAGAADGHQQQQHQQLGATTREAPQGASTRRLVGGSGTTTSRRRAPCSVSEGGIAPAHTPVPLQRPPPARGRARRVLRLAGAPRRRRVPRPMGRRARARADRG